MKTKTVVELSEKEVQDALIEKAKQAVKPHGGGVTVEFTHACNAVDTPAARVVFEWGVK